MTPPGDPVDRKQLRALVSLSVKLHTRGRAGRTRYGRILSVAVSYGLASFYLSWTLSRNFHEPSFVAIGTIVTMYLACYTVLTSYSILFLDPEERRILHLFPISRRTILSSRIVNLFLFALLLSAPFVIPLAVFHFLYSGSAAHAVAFFVVLTASFLWATAGSLIIYNSLILRFVSSSRLLALVQSAFVFLLLFFYQGLPSFATAYQWWEGFLASKAAPLSPAHWFVAVYAEWTGRLSLPAGRLLMVQAVITSLFLILLARSRWLLLPDIALSPDMPVAGPSTPATGPGLLDRLPIRKAETRAGYELFNRLIARDRTLRFQVIPILMMPLAVAVYGLLTGGLASPFMGRIFSPESKVHIPILVFFLFASRHIDQTVLKALQPSSVWLLRAQTHRALIDYARGVRRAVVTRLLLPQALLLAAVFIAVMPPAEAVLQAGFLLSTARFQTSLLTYLRPRIPFSAVETHLDTIHRFSQLFVILPFIIGALFLHLEGSHSPAVFATALISMECVNAILGSMPRKLPASAITTG
ncbi:MAG: hypothetical protein QHI48_03660 [Bacteroidota bacterium]|nr:hypothetical protein [Bacteroidota bacterium]